MELSAKDIENLKKGDKNAQRTLYEAYAAKMYGLCLRFLSNDQVARDVLHDSFVKVFTSVKDFKGKGKLENWVKKIVINECLEYHRKKRNSMDVDLAEAPEMEFTYDNTEYDAQFLLKVVSELSPQYRMVFNLFSIEGYSHAEIAELLNISESTSKSNYFRARAILRARLSKLVDYSYEKAIR